MKIVASVGVLVALVVVGCGGGAPPGDGRTLEERAKAAATAAQRQRVLDACKPHLTRAFCGVAIPRNGNDKTPQRWWNAAGCLADHPNKFSAQCKSLFNSTCSDSGDDCICDPGYVLNERDRCVQPGECDSDNECPAVANGKSRCTSHEESDPPTGHCVVTCKAGFVLTNGACVPPPPPNKVVFVTSQTYTAALGGLAGADAKCQSLATGAGLTGTYKAWLSSSSVDARDRLTHSAIPYVLSDRTTVVADNWSDLVDGSLKHAIDKTETGAAGPSSDAPGLCGTQSVLTYTNSDGTKASFTSPPSENACSDWTSSDSSFSHVQWGNWGSSDFRWTFCSTAAGPVCGFHSPLYCLEQ